MMQTILVTGGSGFIGSAVVRKLVESKNYHVINLDKKTYAAVPEANEDLWESQRFNDYTGDVCDAHLLHYIFRRHEPSSVIHLAAETHVDRSIQSPMGFVNTNVMGTARLFFVLLSYWNRRQDTRFIQVSTDEVYGDIPLDVLPRVEGAPVNPSSPYSASKLGGEALALSYCRTYSIPVIVTRGANTYGPWQHPEKFIPKVISNASQHRKIPIYASGNQMRDWIHVQDHASAILHLLENGAPGQIYNVSQQHSVTNIALAKKIIKILSSYMPEDPPTEELFAHVDDRPGHDFRYAVDSSKLCSIGWEGKIQFEDGLRSTVAWYLDYQDWARERFKNC